MCYLCYWQRAQHAAGTGRYSQLKSPVRWLKGIAYGREEQGLWVPEAYLDDDGHLWYSYLNRLSKET